MIADFHRLHFLRNTGSERNSPRQVCDTIAASIRRRVHQESEFFFREFVAENLQTASFRTTVHLYRSRRETSRSVAQNRSSPQSMASLSSRNFQTCPRMYFHGRRRGQTRPVCTQLDCSARR